MRLWCWLFHRKYQEKLLVWERRWVGWNRVEQWWGFVHCSKCHYPLLDPDNTYTTPADLESKARIKMIERM